MPDLSSPLKVVSLLLQYPDDALLRDVATIRIEEVGPANRRQIQLLGRFLDWYRAEDPAQLRQGYVDAFDFDRRRSLHLTYQLHGDSRQRGLALLKIKTAYRELGLEPDETELPDYLPLMLEFAALAPGGRGIKLLDRHRESIELIRGSLKKDGSQWAEPIEVVVEALPGLTSRQVNRIRRLAEEGPPTEEVGLEPFAPPEVMPSRPGDMPVPLIGGR